MSAKRHSVADRLRRMFATASAGLVLALTILAASPIAHQLLHVDDVAKVDHDCAVVLFAAGVSLPLGPLQVGPPAEAALDLPAVIAPEIFLVAPRHLRQPERGPPASRVS